MTADGGDGDRLILVLDAGTGSGRAIAFDTSGQAAGLASREWTHPLEPGIPGGIHFDTAGNWELLVDCVRELGRQVDLSRVGAVAATSMREGFVLFGADGDELWACPNADARGAAQARALVESGMAKEVYRRSGDWVSITAPARLAWLREHQPARLDRARHLGMLADWITFRLSGEHVTDPSLGSSSGMFDLSTRVWSPATADLLGLDLAILPPVVEPGTVVGTVRPAVAEATGLPPTAKVVVGGADTQMAVKAMDVRPGQLGIIAGTFWQHTTTAAAPVIDPGTRVRTLCAADPGRWMIEGIGFFSGLALRWFRDAFCPDAAAGGGDPYEAMERWAAGVPAGSNGVLAMLGAVMQADNWVHASPSLLQFDIMAPERSNRAACVRAIEEAAAYVSRAHRDILAEVTGVPHERVMLAGGASRGTLWPRIIAGVLGTPVYVFAQSEMTALGTAMCAATGLGAGGGPFPSARQGRPVQPDPEEVTAYEDAYQRWRGTYDQFQGFTNASSLTPLWRAPGTTA